MKRYTAIGVTSLLAQLACSRGPSNREAIGRSGALSGTWRGTDGNLRVTLVVAQRGDSLIGDGTYSVVDADRMGCGGSDIPAAGPVTLAGVVEKENVGGQLRFNVAAWTPPYIGSVATHDSIVGGLMSVDRGRCPLTLVRQR